MHQYIFTDFQCKYESKINLCVQVFNENAGKMEKPIALQPRRPAVVKQQLLLDNLVSHYSPGSKWRDAYVTFPFGINVPGNVYIVNI